MKIALYILLVVLFVLICVLIYLLFGLLKPKQQTPPQSSKALDNSTDSTKNTKKAPDIETLLRLASDSALSKNQLGELILAFCRLSFPPKSAQLSDEAKKYLSFIMLIASHKNADAKTVAYLNEEAKKKNPTYASEIEEYENVGLQSRKARK